MCNSMLDNIEGLAYNGAENSLQDTDAISHLITTLHGAV